MPVSDNQPSTWEEPPWSGFIETTGDALLILEAARRGLIPRVTRRLVDSERKMITSGSVFVFDEDESGIKRWTDGFYWSPSRILGNFLLYRETDKRGGSRGKGDSGSSDAVDVAESARGDNSLSRSRMDESRLAVDKHIERNLLGSLTNSYKFKPDGLMKKTFSLTINGVSQHLISYYKIEDVTNGRLRSPSSLPELASLDISPEYLDKTHFRSPPKVEVGIDGVPRYRGEADDIDTSAANLTGPLSTGLPVVTHSRPVESGGRRIAGPSNPARRFEPYAGQSSAPSAPKRNRRQTKSSPDPTTPTSEQPQASPEQQQERTASPPDTTTAAPSAYTQPPATPAQAPAQPLPVAAPAATATSPVAAAPPAPVPPLPSSTPAYPPPYPVPGYYQPPGYPPLPPHHHPYVPPNVALQPAPQIQPAPAVPYPAPASVSTENASQPPPPSEAQPTYGYAYPPPPQSMYPPPGYGSPWPPYGMYPHATPMMHAPIQPAMAKTGQAPANTHKNSA